MRAAQQAAESLAAGLRAEKALWSDELATQGARLAQDRGRLEAKIEALAAERASLAKQLEVCACSGSCFFLFCVSWDLCSLYEVYVSNLQQESDSIRIKVKIIDDQTETIRKLKEVFLFFSFLIVSIYTRTFYT